jgi:hypothetical protein
MTKEVIIDFNKPPSVYWKSDVKASYLQRQIIIHSIIYYELSENVINDKMFDNLCKQLISLSKTMTENEYKKTEYYELFKDFDGSTGFNLYHELSKERQKYLMNIAMYVLKLSKME